MLCPQALAIHDWEQFVKDHGLRIFSGGASMPIAVVAAVNCYQCEWRRAAAGGR
jgi:hypothetical protein